MQPYDYTLKSIILERLLKESGDHKLVNRLQSLENPNLYDHLVLWSSSEDRYSRKHWFLRMKDEVAFCSN